MEIIDLQNGKLGKIDWEMCTTTTTISCMNGFLLKTESVTTYDYDDQINSK